MIGHCIHHCNGEGIERAQIRVNSLKTPQTFHITGPLWGESTAYPVDSPHKGPVMWSFDVFYVVSLGKLLNKQSNCLWFETTCCSCDITVNDVWRTFRKQIWSHVDGSALYSSFSIRKILHWAINVIHWNCLHFDKIFITYGTGSCHIDKVLLMQPVMKMLSKWWHILFNFLSRNSWFCLEYTRLVLLKAR